MAQNSFIPRLKRFLKDPFVFIKWYHYQKSRAPKDNLFLVTFNHGGTHWLRMIFANAMIEHYGLQDDITDIKNFDLIPPFHRKTHRFKYNANTDILRIQQSHAWYSKTPFKGQRVVLMVRDLRDVMVSHYKSYITRNSLDLSFADYLRDLSIKNNLRNRIEFLNSWHDKHNDLLSFHIIRFEDLKDNPNTALHAAFTDTFTANTDIGSLINNSVQKSSLDRMKKIEDATQSTETKIRDGASKKYHDYFSASDKAFFMGMVNKYLVHDYGYDYKDW